MTNERNRRMPHHIRRAQQATRSALVLAAAAALLLAAACGDDEDDTPAPATGTIEITAVDYGFEGVPERVAAGSSFTLTNASSIELHELVAIRMVDGETRSIEDLLELSDEELDEVFAPGPPAMVLIAMPNEESFAVVGDGTFTEPGRYALVCFIPTGADPDEFMAAAEASSDGPPEVDGGPPHAFVGMYGEVTVE